MTRYLEQTQSTAIAFAKLLSRVGFSRPPWLWFLHLRHAGVPISSPVLPSKSTISSTSTSAGCSVGVACGIASLIAAFQDGLGDDEKAETEISVLPLVSFKTTLLTLKLPEDRQGIESFGLRTAVRFSCAPKTNRGSLPTQPLLASNP
jgi:hypothetical protein